MARRIKAGGGNGQAGLFGPTKDGNNAGANTGRVNGDYPGAEVGYGGGLDNQGTTQLSTLATGPENTLVPEPPAGRWVRLDPFNPRSPAQVLKMIAALGHPTPLDRWGRITTGRIELERLARRTGHSVYQMILDLREYKTQLSTFLATWTPPRAHPVFYTAPATGQHSSRRPNGQNTPKHTSLAKAFNWMIRAATGHKMVALDWKSFHVVTLAFESRDQALMRVARIDPHTFVTAHFARIDQPDRLLALSDGELADKLRWIRSCGGRCTHSGVEKREGRCWGWLRDAKVKHSVLGYNLGMGPATLFYRHREDFSGMGEARALLGLMDRLFPAAAAWRKAIAIKAHRQRFLVSRWGFLRYFYEVFRPDYSGPVESWTHGDDYEAAVSFLVQNDAHGYRNDVMDRLSRAGLDERYRLIVEVHDDLRFECPDPLVDECLAAVSAEMVRPQPVLSDPVMAPEGLWCGVSASVGPSWAEMEGVRL